MGSYGDVLPMRGRSRRRGVASALASLFTRPMESLGACAAISLFVYALMRFGVGSSGDVGSSPGLGGRGSAVSAFIPAKIDVAKVQRSCVCRKDGAGAVLITGSAGFVGFHTALALRESGWGVLGLDNVNDYYPTSLKRARMREPVSYTHLRAHETDS